MASTLITGCDNPKAANESNFKKAINEALPKDNLNCFPVKIPTGRLFPTETPVNFPIVAIKDKEAVFLKPLAKVGLLSTSNLTPEDISKVFGISVPEAQTISAKKYELTSEGKKFFSIQSKDSIIIESKFCLGEPEVDKIVNFTEGQNQLVNFVDVKYTYRVKNIPQWAQDPDVQTSIPKVAEIVKSQDTPIEDSMVLQLTNKGWSNQL